MQPSSDDHRPMAGRHRLATVGLAGVALALSAVAGTPALAGAPGSHSSHSSTGQSSGGHGASEKAGSGNDGSGHNPPGNNGTVFIHDVAGDHSPHNVPHVGCTFFVDFFGFDDGQPVTVSFAGQAPTGKDVALGGTWTGVVSTDDASGAGNDFDDELAFTADQLGVTALGPAAKQGYHVKMTVATNEPGGKKSKVFWIAPCTTSGVSGGGTIAAGGTTGGAAVSAAGAVKTPARGGSATVLGERFTRGTAGSSVAGLPFTGARIGLMTVAALAALTVGTGLTMATRRRRASPIAV
jgi:hypothetical protein